MAPPEEPLPGKDPPPPKLSRLEEARRLIEEYTADLREIIKKLRRRLNRAALIGAALLKPIRHHPLDIASELPEMDSEALVKLALLDSRRASGDLIRMVGFGAQLLCASLHVLHKMRSSATAL